MRELFKRVAKLENKKKSKPALEEILCTAKRCDHAGVECKCTCENHIAESLEEFVARPVNCICRQFHKPPIIPCGCVSMEELNSIEGYSISIDLDWSLVDNYSKLRQIVPGMFRFDCNQNMDSFKICRRDNEIIKKVEGRVEILAEIPYKKLLARYGVSP